MTGDAVTRCRVDGVADRSSFLAAVGQGLSFPPYYGHNLDALDECLRDLSWLPPGPVTIEWDDVPLREQDPEGHRLLLDLLDDVAADPEGPSATRRPLTVIRSSRDAG